MPPLPKPDRVWATHIQNFAAYCADFGLDLVQPFSLARFHEQLREDQQHQRLHDFGRTHCLAIVVGNSRALWHVFLRRARRDVAHPLDDYVTRAVTRAAIATLPAPTEVHWAHHRAPVAIPIQRIAHAAGLAHLGPAHLCVHDEHGPWIGLRAVVVVDADFPPELRPPQPMPAPCSTCATRPCEAALERALEASRTGTAGEDEGAAPVPRGLDPVRRAWLRVRDACPVGAASRYDVDQIAFHYGAADLTRLPTAPVDPVAPPSPPGADPSRS